MSRHVIVVDAYDSFVHILVSYFEAIGCRVSLYRKDDKGLGRAVQDVDGDALVLGPGPGHPVDSGYGKILDLNKNRMPVLGVCLGHQAIGLHYGCQIAYAKHLIHGKTSPITHDGKGCFRSLEKEVFLAMRYHSLVISDGDYPKDLEITARSMDDGYIMGVRSSTLKVEGIQFHPESIGAEFGVQILRNFMDTYVH